MSNNKRHNRFSDEAAQLYQSDRSTLWNERANNETKTSIFSRYYKRRLSKVYKNNIPPGSKVLELGCGKGDLLSALKPALGVGIDFSKDMVSHARKKYPDLTFHHQDVHHLNLDSQTFDYVILSDLINDLWDMKSVLEHLHCACDSQTRIIFNNYNRFWEPVLFIGRKLGWGKPQLQRNWLSSGDLRNLLQISNYYPIREWQEILLPVDIPLLESIFNKFLVKLWPFKSLGLTKYLVARPLSSSAESQTKDKSLVSIIVPARNEAGHIEALFKRLPHFDYPTELVFVEGHSHDETYSKIEEMIAKYPTYDSSLFRQSGKGKKDAVELGIEKANGEILTILDADLTVAPEDLPSILQVIINGHGEFINGVRMVYPQEKEAMRFFNLLGNKLFAWLMSNQLGQHIGDALCGTKVFLKKDFETFSKDPSYLGSHDPFGDFTLLFGAAKLNLHIVNVPVRYRRRVYGSTNIQRWTDGAKLFQLVLKGAQRIKFV